MASPAGFGDPWAVGGDRSGRVRSRRWGDRGHGPSTPERATPLWGVRASFTAGYDRGRAGAGPRRWRALDLGTIRVYLEAEMVGFPGLMSFGM